MSLKISSQKRIFFLFIILLSNSLLSQSIDLKDYSNQADYLVITTSDFVNNLTQLIDLRESQGLSTKTILVDTIYQQFSDSSSKQWAIKLFTGYTLEYWSEPKPQYLLLVGDVELVPSFKVLSQYKDLEDNQDSVSIDDQYAINLYEEDYVPDIAIGRLPVTNNQQLENIIKKILLFENDLERENYTTDYFGLADYSDSEYIFEQIQTELIQNTMPDYFTFQRIDRRDGSEYYGTTSDILNIINSGCFFLSYSGHGNPFIWADSSFFIVDSIENICENGLPFILTSVACSQNFNIPDSFSIVEAMLHKKNGGSVACFTSSGISFATAGNQIIHSFYNRLFQQPDQTIGNIILQTKQEIHSGFRPDDIDSRYTLLGDPALKFPSDITGGISHPEPNIISGLELYQNYPNPFNGSTLIKFNIPSTDLVHIITYNMQGKQVQIIHNGVLNKGVHSKEWNPAYLASGVYFIRLSAGNLNKTIKTIYMK